MVLAPESPPPQQQSSKGDSERGTQYSTNAHAHNLGRRQVFAGICTDAQQTSQLGPASAVEVPSACQACRAQRPLAALGAALSLCSQHEGRGPLHHFCCHICEVDILGACAARCLPASSVCMHDLPQALEGQ